MAQEGGDEADLVGAGDTGDGSAGQVDFQGGRAGFRGEFGDEEGGRAFGAGLDSSRFRPAIHAAKAGYLMPHCRAKSGALRLLDW